MLHLIDMSVLCAENYFNSITSANCYIGTFPFSTFRGMQSNRRTCPLMTFSCCL